MTMQDQINKAFAELNQQMMDNQIAWAKGRKEALKAYDREQDPNVLAYREAQSDPSTPVNYRQSEWSIVLGSKIRICGGKTWYSIFNERLWDDIEPMIVKNVQNLIAKRDARILKALTKHGITELPEFTLTHTSDGYEGTFNVAGHIVSIRTILAGGYNIQCLHQRTLVKVKETKEAAAARKEREAAEAASAEEQAASVEKDEAVTTEVTGDEWLDATNNVLSAALKMLAESENKKITRKQLVPIIMENTKESRWACTAKYGHPLYLELANRVYQNLEDCNLVEAV